MKKTDYNAKITEIESKIPSISGLAITAALTAVEYKIPDVSNLVKKNKTKKKHYNTKILGTECEYFTTADYNKFTSQTLDAKIKQKGLVDKSPIAGFLSNAELDNKVAALTKAELKAEQDKIIKLQTFDSSYFRSKSHFEDDGTDNFKKNGNTDRISLWKSKGLSEESINPPSASDNSLAPALYYFCNKTRVKFDE